MRVRALPGLVFLILACAWPGSPAAPAPGRPPAAEPPSYAPEPDPRAVRPITPERISEPRWVDPDFARSTGARRAMVWFDRQLLGTGTSYAEQTAREAEAPRRALRKAAIRELRSLGEASFGAAKPELDRLAAAGAVRDCRPHWIVNGFTCDLPKGDPAVLDRVPGVSKIFMGGRGREPGGAEVGPRQVADTPVAAPFVAKGAEGTWNLRKLRIPEVWHTLGRTGKGVRIAVHDYGFRLDVAPIAATLFRNPGEIAGNGVDDEGDGYVDDVHGFAFDSHDTRVNRPEVKPNGLIHGDAVAALIVGRAPIGGTEPIGGAPDAVWAAITAEGAIEEAVEWALLHDFDVYSMSFSNGGLGDRRAHWRKVMEQGAFAGLFFVSGAGNFGEEGSPGYEPVPVQMRIPEDIPLAVFGVTGIGPNGQRPKFSSQGPVNWSVEHYREGRVDKPDFATINAGVPSLAVNGRILPRPGTGNSFAAPHLAAVLALMIEADPDLTPWAARAILSETAVDIGTPGFDPQFGFGLVDAFAAVKAVEARRR